MQSLDESQNKNHLLIKKSGEFNAEKPKKKLSVESLGSGDL